MNSIHPLVQVCIVYILRLKYLFLAAWPLTYHFVDLKFKLDFKDYSTNTITCKSFSVHPNPTLLGFST